MAPDFTVPDQDGRTVTLSSFQGQSPVVLIFYPGDSTPVCTKQLCEVRDAYAEFQAAGAVVFGVNPWGEESHRKFAERHQFPFSLLVDRGNEVARRYDAVLGWGPLSLPNRSVYVIGKDGRVLFARRGKPGPDEVLQVLRA